MQLILFRRHMLRYLFRTKVTNSSDLQVIQACKGGDNKIVPLFKKALLYANNICIKDFGGQYTYLQLYDNSQRLSRQISNICGSGSSSTVAIFNSNDVLTMVILWACWMSGQKVLALKRGQPDNQLNDLIKRTKANLIISSDLFEKCSKKIAFDNSIPLMHIDHNFLNIHKSNNCLNPQEIGFIQNYSEGVILNEFYNNSGAIVFYNNENGFKTILQNHKELDIQIKKAVQTWNMSGSDKILYMCPSFHSYNDEYIFNLLFPLSVSSQVFIFEPFDSKLAWRAILGINVPPKDRPNALIAEPKIYQQLIQEYQNMFAVDKRMVEHIKDHCTHNIRLMMSCFYRSDPMISSMWLKITGHYLLESDYSIEYLNSRQFVDVRENSGNICFPKGSNMKVRIVNAKNDVLLELDETQAERFPILSSTLIGRIMVSNNDEMFRCTGEMVSFRKGVFKKIGRCSVA